MNPWNTVIAYVGGFIIFLILGAFGSSFIMDLYDMERPFESDESLRADNKKASDKVSMRIGLVAGIGWILYRYFSH
jgi:hypothetical protein